MSIISLMETFEGDRIPGRRDVDDCELAVDFAWNHARE